MGHLVCMQTSHVTCMYRYASSLYVIFLETCNHLFCEIKLLLLSLNNNINNKTIFLHLSSVQEHLDYELVQSTNPEFNKAVVRVNIFRDHRQTIQVKKYMLVTCTCK